MLMYYLYRHTRLDINTPFYIGVGTFEDADNFKSSYKRAFTKGGRNKYWINITNKVDYKVDILYEDISKEVILNKEIEFIKLYGLKQDGGILCNMTYGGEHTTFSQEMKDRISKRMLGNKNSLGNKPSEYNRLQTSLRFKGNTIWRGRKHKDESKQKLSAKLKGRKLSEEHIKSLMGSRSSNKPIICNDIKYNSTCDCVRLLFNCNTTVYDNKFRSYKNGIIRQLKGKIDFYKGYKFEYL